MTFLNSCVRYVHTTLRCLLQLRICQAENKPFSHSNNETLRSLFILYLTSTKYIQLWSLLSYRLVNSNLWIHLLNLAPISIHLTRMVHCCYHSRNDVAVLTSTMSDVSMFLSMMESCAIIENNKRIFVKATTHQYLDTSHKCTCRVLHTLYTNICNVFIEVYKSKWIKKERLHMLKNIALIRPGRTLGAGILATQSTLLACNRVSLTQNRVASGCFTGTEPISPSWASTMLRHMGKMNCE